MQNAIQESNHSSGGSSPTLYRHVKKHEWGLALLAWERDGKRAFRFEDGEVRIFKEGYYGLLEEVDRPADRTTEIVAKIDREHGVSSRRRGGQKEPEREVTFDEQLEVFLAEFPDGFESAAWVEQHRGGGAGRRLKRHRDSAIDDARRQLGADALRELIDAGDFDAVRQRAIDVLEATDLVTRAQIKPIEESKGDERVADALFQLLHGTGSMEERFDKFCHAVAHSSRKLPSWPLITALVGLVDPQEHLCIRPSVFSAQAKWMAPSLQLGKQPKGAIYTRFVDMAKTILENLRNAGQKPRDLLDIYDFVWFTLRPAASETLENVRKRKASESESEAEAEPASSPAEATASTEPH
jgi:hypothetical protein